MAAVERLGGYDLKVCIFNFQFSFYKFNFGILFTGNKRIPLGRYTLKHNKLFTHAAAVVFPV